MGLGKHMTRKIDSYEFNAEERFVSDAILDLQSGNTTYVYKEYILDRLKQIFSDLDIVKNEFYWTVRRKK